MNSHYTLDDLLDLKICDVIKKRWHYNHKHSISKEYLDDEIKRIKGLITNDVLNSIIETCIGKGCVDNH